MKIKKAPDEFSIQLDPGEYFGILCERCQNPVQVIPPREGTELEGQGAHFVARCSECEHHFVCELHELEVFKLSE